jgi:hypothetical protein
MKHRLVLIATVSALSACVPGSDKSDVLSVTGTTVVAATIQCTVPNADAVRCDKKTCKKDARGDCSSFMDRCTKYGHSYEGNADEGTCIRGDQVG